MQFLTGLFGGTEGAILNAALALGIVLVLILLGLWLLKLLFRASGTVGRGKNRRLSVVDSLAIDQRRQLLIVRRDDVEHLILTGGTQDVVVESGIPVPPAPVPVPRQQAGRRPAPAQPAVATDAKVASPKLRELAAAPQPAAKPTSLRHTGFMRAGEDAEAVAIPANADSPGSDSARTSHPDEDMQAAGGDNSQSDMASARKADTH